jgi:hypothetical protein
MRVPLVKFTIGQMMLAIAASAVALGLVVGCPRVWLGLMVDLYEISVLADQEVMKDIEQKRSVGRMSSAHAKAIVGVMRKEATRDLALLQEYKRRLADVPFSVSDTLDHAAQSVEKDVKLREKREDGRGTALEGRLADTRGNPLRGVMVIFYEGLTTHRKTAVAVTDANGQYRHEWRQSVILKDPKAKPRELDCFVGVRFEHPTHVEADACSWHLVRVKGGAGIVERLDLNFTTGGHIEGRLTDAKTGKPLKKLDLKIEAMTHSKRRDIAFDTYEATDDEGHFRSHSLYPGTYGVTVNSTTMDYPVVGHVKVEAGKVTLATFSVSLPRIIKGRVVGADGKPLEDVELTLLAPEDSDASIKSMAEFVKLRTRAWTVSRPSWKEHFELAFVQGLEQSRFVLAVHQSGWAKIPVEILASGQPIRLRPWEPKVDETPPDAPSVGLEP